MRDLSKRAWYYNREHKAAQAAGPRPSTRAGQCPRAEATHTHDPRTRPWRTRDVYAYALVVFLSRQTGVRAGLPQV